MQLIELLKESDIYFENDISSKDEILNFLSDKYTNNEKINKNILNALKKREKVSSTGIGGGIAIPHAICKEVKDLKIIIIINKKGIEYNSLDGKPVYAFIGIFANVNDQKHYLSLLANTARVFSKKNILKRILNLNEAKDILKEIKKVSKI